MENKTYLMTNLSDILEPLTEDNYLNFLEDFKQLIESTLEIRSQIPKNIQSRLMLTSMEWTDDDQRGVKKIYIDGILHNPKNN